MIRILQRDKRPTIYPQCRVAEQSDELSLLGSIASHIPKSHSPFISTSWITNLSRSHYVTRTISIEMAAFGFSFGDFVDGIELIRQLINAVKDGAGSSREYQDLVHELYSLERALLEVKRVQAIDELRPQRIAMEQAALQCQETISQFLSKISKYQPSLRVGGSGSTWRDGLRKIQWALYRKEDVQRFRAQIQGHTSSIMTLLMTMQL